MKNWILFSSMLALAALPANASAGVPPINPIPEPSSLVVWLAIVGLGAVAYGWRSRRK